MRGMRPELVADGHEMRLESNCWDYVGLRPESTKPLLFPQRMARSMEPRDSPVIVVLELVLCLRALNRLLAGDATADHFLAPPRASQGS